MSAVFFSPASESRTGGWPLRRLKDSAPSYFHVVPYCLVYALPEIPGQIIHPRELGFIPTMAMVGMVIACSEIIYLSLSLALWMRSKTHEAG